MSLIDRREREKEQRRNSIVDAAEKLFFSKGVNHTTMDDISNETELSKGTLYLYFKSKEELYSAIILRGMKALQGLFEKAVNAQACGLFKLYSMGIAMLEFSVSFPNYFDAIFYHNLVVNNFPMTNHPDLQEMESISNDMFRISTDALHIGIADGSIRPDVDVNKVAFSLYGLITGLIRTIKIEGDHMLKCHGLSPQDLVESSFDLIKHALQNPVPRKECATCAQKCKEQFPSFGISPTQADNKGEST